MKRVLAVSDDTDFHAFLAQACAESGAFQLVSAQNGWEAMAELRLRPAAVALLDFNASSWDAYQLLGEIHQQHPSLAIIGLTRTPEVAMERRMKHAGAVRMLNRRVRPEALIEELGAMLDSSAKGHIEGIHLASLLQVLDWERKNCMLRIQSGGRTGLLHFQRGYLVHADSQDQSGEAAGIEILGWEDARIDFLPYQDVERTIHLPLKEILMRAAQLRDEFGRDTRPEAWDADGALGDPSDFGDPLPSPGPS